MIPKPLRGHPCNGCGYCCSVEPCALAREFLGCSTGPCGALESREGRTVCGLVRNPLAYLFRAANPGADVDVLSPAPANEKSARLSTELAAALGLGLGCDADDDPGSLQVWLRQDPC